MKESSPAPIGHLIGLLASRYRWQSRFCRKTIWTHWPEIIGDMIAQHSWPLKFKERDVLVVAVSDSVWMQQLSLQKLTMLDAINSRLPQEGMVRDIRFKIGDVDEVRKMHMPASLSVDKSAGRGSAGISEADIPEEIRQEIRGQAQALTEPVRDEELKKMLMKVYIKSRLKGPAL